MLESDSGARLRGWGVRARSQAAARARVRSSADPELSREQMARPGSGDAAGQEGILDLDLLILRVVNEDY